MPAPDLSSYKVAASELSSSTKFNNLVQAIQDEFGDIDADQIPGFPSDATKYLRGDGSWAALLAAATGLPFAYDRSSSVVDVVTTAVETALYSKQIAAGDMGTTRLLRLILSGDFLHNNGAGDTVTFKVKFGGSIFWQTTWNLGGSASAARHPWEMAVRLQNMGAANSQSLSGHLYADQTGEGAPTVGIGVVPNTLPIGGPFASTNLGTIDTSSAQTLEVSVQWSASSANNSFRLRGAVLELV